MVSKTKSDWPPPGWKVVVKKKSGRKFKCYINSKNHKKFYSKAAVLRYIDGCISNKQIEPAKEDAKKNVEKKQMHLAEANEFEWLPADWVLERKIRKSGDKAGNEYKCYIEPSTGTKFYSKPEVLRYLGNKDCSPGSSREKDGGGGGHSYSKRPVDPPSILKSSLEPNVLPLSKTHVWKNLSLGKQKVVIERTVDEELPSGWIKETRIKHLRNKVVRRDSIFHDPAGTLVFRSKMEVLRYVETGEISRHAYRRKTGSIIGKIPTTFSDKREETPKRTRKQLYVGKASTVPSIQELPATQGNKNDSGSKSKRSSARLRSASADSSPLQSKLSSESTKISQHMVGTKQIPEKVSGTKKSIGSIKKSEHSSLSAGILSRENTVVAAVKGCSNGKVQPSKRNTRHEKSPSVPSRSSKRLAGVDVEVVFHPIPIEHACQALSRKSSGTKSVPGDLQGKHQTVDMNDCTEPALEATCRKTSRTKPVPSLVPAAVQRCSTGKAQASKRKTRHGKLPSEPSRSSKRLAGADAETMFHQIPIEYASRAINRKSPGTKTIPRLVSDPGELKEKYQTDNAKDWIEPTLQATCTNSPRGKSVSSLASVPSDLQKNYSDVMQDLLAFQEEKNCTPDVDPEFVLGTQGQPSNKIDDFTFQEEICQTHGFDVDIAVTSNKIVDITSEETKQCLFDANKENPLATLGESFAKLDDSTSLENEHCTLDVDGENVLATRGEPSNKIDDLRYEETKNPILVDRETMFVTLGEPSNKLGDLTTREENICTLDVPRETVLVTRGEPSNKVDILAAKKPILVDLNFLQLEQPPPGFSKDPEVKVPSSTIKQSLEHPVNTVMGSKVESTSRVRPIIERPGSIQRETEQPQSDFCFSSPLWSDPCLEFAYKTLTGAIPFDDNLAIQDYIQHQLRTTEENNNSQSAPDICAPSFSKNNEAKTATQLPGDANFSNSNGFGSPEIKQVKKYK